MNESDHSHLSDIEARVRALESLLTRRATLTRRPSMRSSTPTKPRSGPETARRWWRRHGATRTSGDGCARTSPPPLRRWA